MFFFVAGYHFYFSLQLLQVKKEMKESLSTVNRSSLQVFHFNKTDYARLTWEDDNEFSINGNMYDVIEKHETNGLVSIKCIADNKETSLLAAQLHTRQQSNNNNLIVIKLISIPFVLNDMNQSLVTINKTQKQFCCNCHLFSSFHPAAFPQPPENC
jgi:hypothetical protein